MPIRICLRYSFRNERGRVPHCRVFELSKEKRPNQYGNERMDIFCSQSRLRCISPVRRLVRERPKSSVIRWQVDDAAAEAQCIEGIGAGAEQSEGQRI